MSVAPRLKAVLDIPLESMTDQELKDIVDAGTTRVKLYSGGDVEIEDELLQRTPEAVAAMVELNRRCLFGE